jgi:hypothetical protein
MWTHPPVAAVCHAANLLIHCQSDDSTSLSRFVLAVLRIFRKAPALLPRGSTRSLRRTGDVLQVVVIFLADVLH